MTSLLEFKSKVESFYQKYSIYIDHIFKFIVALIVFILINSNIGYDERLKSIPLVLALSLVCAFTPPTVMILLAIAISLIHIFHISPILAGLVLIIMLIIYFLYIHFTPELGFVLIALPILSFINIPYVIPMVLGIFFTPISIIASASGVIIIYLFEIIAEVVNMQFANTIEDAIEIFNYVIGGLVNNKEMMMTIIIYSLVILITYIVRRQKVDYAQEAAVGAGALTCILGFLFADLRLGITEQIGPMIIGTLFSAVIVLVIQFFYRVLDYSRTEYVQFEDDDYYYYVKAVPKIKVTEQKINIKRINPQRRYKKDKEDIEDKDNENNNEDFYEDISYDDLDDDFYDDLEFDDLEFDDLDDDLYDDDLHFEDDDK